MKLKIDSEKKPIYIYAGIIFLAMLIMTSMTPLIADDYDYSFNWVTLTRMTSFKEIIPSLKMHWKGSNGRVIVHAAVFALRLMPKAVFNILNAGNSVLLVFLFQRYCRGNSAGISVLLLSVAAMMIWNYSPAFGEDFFWLAGSLNYAWSMTLLIIFIWPFAADYLRIERKQSAFRSVGYCILCFAAGDTMESGSLAMLFVAACLLVLMLIRDRKVSSLLWIGFILGLLGYVFLMSCPATSSKAGSFDLSSLVSRIAAVISSVRNRLLILYSVYALLFAVGLFMKTDKRYLIFSALLVLSGLAALLSYGFAKYMYLRHYCYTVVITTLSCFVLLSELVRSKEKLGKLSVYLCAAFLLFPFLFNLAAGAIDISVGFVKWREREAAIAMAREQGETQLVLERHLCSTSYGVNFALVDDPWGWPNGDIAMYYGFDGIAVSNPYSS